jgi:toxin FitB
MWLLDTVTLSEMTRPNPKTVVLDWLANQEPEKLFTSTICIGELRYGIERMAPGQKRDKYRVWLEHIVTHVLLGRMIAFDDQVSKTWAEARVYAPRTLPALDSLIAATALARGLIVVTRNAKDFEAFGVEVFNPWPDN